MTEKVKGRRLFISQRMAIGVITTFFSGTVLGWFLTEVFPSDFQSALESYRARWGEIPVKLSVWLKLYDPFRSFWYTSILILFFVVLLLCILTRWKQFVTRAFTINIPGDMGFLEDRPDRTVVEWAEPAGAPERDTDPVSHYSREHGVAAAVDEGTMEGLYSCVASVLSRRRFSIARSTGSGRISFRAVAGRLRHIGNLVFHAGLLVITAGGMAGSMLGSSEFFYGAKGDLIPIAGEGTFLRVDDFRILMSEEGMIRDYISRLSVVDSSGTVLRTEEIEVNDPMSYKGHNVYQSSYTIGEDYEWIRLACSIDDSAIPLDIVLRPGERASLGEGPTSVVAGRFFPDFRMGPAGPYSASARMVNPAVTVHLLSPA
ncbi:MAG TPA: cytochrome c biogenesis protein ResB, partial [Candidatus Krumholzibacterium sp.]|nr:cytochrome c biogenesis protein ResB [Candidatus Krumholzibacterium sp.]